MNQPITTYVIAGSFARFREWCTKNKIGARSPKVQYVSRGEHLFGVSPEGARIVVIDNKAATGVRWSYIREAAEAAIRRGVEVTYEAE